MQLRFGLKLCFLIMLAGSVLFAWLRPRPEVFEFHAFVRAAGAAEFAAGTRADLGAVIVPQPSDTWDSGHDYASIAVEMAVLEVRPGAHAESHPIYGWKLCWVKASVQQEHVELMRLALKEVPNTQAQLMRYPSSRLVVEVAPR